MATSANSAELTSIPHHDSRRWLIVVAAFFGVMVSFGSLLVFTFGVFLKPLSAEFGWSRESVSAAFGIAAMSVAVASPFIGILLDRFGPRPVILPCMIVFGAALASLSLLTPNLLHFYAIFLVLGIVGNGTTQMGYSRAISSWFDENRGLALALVVAGVGVGSIVLPPFAQWMIDAHGWRTAYAVLGLLVLLLGVPLTAVFVRERTRTIHVEATAPNGSATDFSVRSALRSRAFWLIVVMLFVSSIAINGAITHLSALLTDRGIPAEKAAFILSVLGGTSLLGRLLTGALLDRFFGPRIAFALLAGVSAGISMLGWARTLEVAVVAAALIGFGLGGEADITPYLLTRYFGLRSFSTLYGLTWTAYAIAGALGPVLMGRVFDRSGSYSTMLSLLAIQTMLAAIAALFMPRYLRPSFRT